MSPPIQDIQDALDSMNIVVSRDHLLQCPHLEEGDLTKVLQWLLAQGDLDENQYRGCLEKFGLRPLEIPIPTQLPPVEGTQWGSFYLKRLLGKGGMGKVYQAVHRDNGQEVALKIFFRTEHSDRTHMRFKREVEALQRLDHPQVPQLYNWGEHLDHLYLATDFVNGIPLDEMIEERGPLSPEETLSIMLDVAQVLARAHQLEILHRDVKPANIILGPDETPYLIDFGLTRNLYLEDQGTQSRDLVGTPPYLSPEQVGNKLSLGPATDIHGWGATLYHCFTGVPPFGTETELGLGNLLLTIVSTPSPSLRKSRPDLEERWERLFQHCMAKNPQNRYQTFEQLVSDLKCLQKGEPLLTAPALSSREFLDAEISVPKQPLSLSNFPRHYLSGRWIGWPTLVTLLLGLTVFPFYMYRMYFSPSSTNPSQNKQITQMAHQLYKKGLRDWREKKYDQAASHLLQSLRFASLPKAKKLLTKVEARLLYTRAMELEKKGEWRQALDKYQQSLEKFRFPEVEKELGRCQAKTRRLLSRPLNCHTATLLPSGAVLIAGGFHSQNLPAVREAEFYSPTQDKCYRTPQRGNNTMAAMRIRRASHTATVLADGRILVAGGKYTAPNITTNGAEVFDEETGQFTPVGKMNYSRAHHSATILSDGRVLVTGGIYDVKEMRGEKFSDVELLNSGEIFDPVTGKWTLTEPMSIARHSHVSVLLNDGRVMVIGGWLHPTGESGYPLKSVEIFHPQTGMWEKGPSLLQARFAPTSLVLENGDVLVTGGRGEKAPYILDSAEIYRVKKGRWERLPPMNQPRWRHQAVLLPSGKVILTGGQDGKKSLASIEYFHPLTNTFSLEKEWELSLPRHSHTLTVLPSGKTLLIGGGTENNHSYSARRTRIVELLPTLSTTFSYDFSNIKHDLPILAPEQKLDLIKISTAHSSVPGQAVLLRVTSSGDSLSHSGGTSRLLRIPLAREKRPGLCSFTLPKHLSYPPGPYILFLKYKDQFSHGKLVLLKK